MISTIAHIFRLVNSPARIFFWRRFLVKWGRLHSSRQRENICEKLFISPFKDKANLQFDSSFAYEVPVLNNTATDLFKAMPEDTPRYSELMAILPAFELFEDVPPTLLRENSLITEFIGGGKYKY